MLYLDDIKGANLFVRFPFDLENFYSMLLKRYWIEKTAYLEHYVTFYFSSMHK